MTRSFVIRVVDKEPTVISGPQYVVCNNSDYLVTWELDEEWASYEHRTMQVNYSDGTYERVLFTGSSCALPPVSVSGQIKIGLYAADIHTTRPVRTLAVHSIISCGGTERAPMPNIYDQLMEKLNALDAENEYTQLSALIDTDTLNAVHNAEGSILTDERGNIILRA